MYYTARRKGDAMVFIMIGGSERERERERSREIIRALPPFVDAVKVHRGCWQGAQH